MGLFDRFKKASPSAAPALAQAQGRDPNAPTRRKAERFATTVLSCPLGAVSDLSVTGMRVLARQAPPVSPGTLFEFEIESPTSSLTVVGRIVRITRQRMSGFDIGIEFQRVTAEVAEALECLARHGKMRNKRPASPPEPPVTAKLNLPDLYANLGIPESASEAQIQHAYRELARAYHPDVNKSNEAHDKFVEVNRSYEVLRDPDKRRAYDEARGVCRAAA